MSDLISRADVLKLLDEMEEPEINDYGCTIREHNITLDKVACWVEDLPSVSAEPKSKVDTTENPKCDFTSAERVGCDSCIYKTMWKEQEKGNVLPEYAEWIEAYNKMVDVNSDEWVEKTDKEFTKMWNENILYRLQERFEEEERKAFAKPHGLKEHAVWNKAIKILQEYMQE